MTDSMENLILEHLRGLRAGQDRLENELRKVAARLTSLEASTAGRRDPASNGGNPCRCLPRALRIRRQQLTHILRP